ncbi:MAG: hypothetical protein HYZ74_01555, partial [Elusimicrobia bacterium]|nr:hypothetical protein [Elusimicrobiota bacterium]
LTPEERAKKAAEAAEAQRVADAEAKKKADEEAAAAAKEQNADGAAADPAALLASAQADGGQQKAGGLGKRFGQLSSGLGGGSALSGGAGLSGGVNQSFSAASLGRGGDAGKITATRSAGKPSTSRAGRSSLASSRLKGFARQQLDNTNTLSRRGLAASKGETASFEAGTPFDNNSKGVENVISGPGVSKGAENSSGGPGANPVTNPGTGGGPTGDTPQCSGSQYPDPNTGSCVSTPEPQNKNVTPYQNLYNIAMGLLMLVTVLGVAALIFEKSAVPYLVAAAKMMKFAIMALGVIIAGLGVAILSMTGDKIAGGILTLTGGFIAATAMMMPKAVTAEVVKQVVIKTLIAATAGGFAAALAHKPAAAAD